MSLSASDLSLGSVRLSEKSSGFLMPMGGRATSGCRFTLPGGGNGLRTGWAWAVCSRAADSKPATTASVRTARRMLHDIGVHPLMQEGSQLAHRTRDRVRLIFAQGRKVGKDNSNGRYVSRNANGANRDDD